MGWGMLRKNCFQWNSLFSNDCILFYLYFTQCPNFYGIRVVRLNQTKRQCTVNTVNCHFDLLGSWDDTMKTNECLQNDHSKWKAAHFLSISKNWASCCCLSYSNITWCVLLNSQLISIWIHVQYKLCDKYRNYPDNTHANSEKSKQPWQQLRLSSELQLSHKELLDVEVR